MLAFSVYRGRLVARAKPRPRLRSGWALVRVRRAGICNTDLEILRGYHNFRGTPGHEFVGEVVRLQAGRREARLWLGRRVVGEINLACAGLAGRRACEYCRLAQPTHCRRRRVLGIVAHDGAFAEYLALPLANLHRVPDEVTDEQAVFTEPLAAACRISSQVRVKQFPEAAVLGDGKLAQLIARVLCAEGLRVVMFGRHAEKLAVARRAGISTVLARGAGGAPFRGPRQWRLVIEATGSPEGLKAALGMTAPRGTVVLKSTFHGVAELATWPLVVHEMTLVGSRCGPFPRALQLLRSGRVDPRPLIARTFPLREAPAAIAEASRRGVLKVLLQP